MSNISKREIVIGFYIHLWDHGYFMTHQGHCDVSLDSLSKTLYPQLNTGSTQEDKKTSWDDCKIVD